MNKINQFSFRDLAKKYLYIDFKPQFPLLAQNFADANQANGILTFCYINHEQGLQFEVLSNAFFNEGKKSIKFFDVNNEASISLPYGLVQECNVLVLPDAIIPQEKFAAKTEKLILPVADGLEKCRSLAAIDSCRKTDKPDEVQVYLAHGDEQIETCSVRLEGINEMQLFGTLLDEPTNDFGIHQGETLYFFMVKNEQGIMCLAPR